MSISKSEAAAILNCETAEEAVEVYEQKLFEWKQKYLMHIPPIKLIEAHIKKINRLNSAATHFINIPFQTVDPYETVMDSLPLQQYIQAYQAQILRIKLAISSTENGIVLVELLSILIQIQKRVYNKLANYEPINSSFHLKAVKISEPGDFYAILKELKEKDIPETEIMNYLSRELKFGSYPFESSLLNEVLKALKQLV